MDYFFAMDPGFGRLAWIFFVFQWFVAVAGALAAFVFTDRYPYRQKLAKQFGIALLIVGGVGTLFGILRLFEVSIFNNRAWFYVLLLVELGVAGYLTYYFRSVYPEKMRQVRSSPPPRPVRRQVATQATMPPAEPRPEPITSRGEARRARKRRSK